MGFRLREHTADVAVEATATDLAGVFAAVANGLAAASCDDVPDPGAEAATFEVSVAAEDRKALLFDYLDQLIYERDVRGVLPVRNRVEIGSPSDAPGSGDPGDLSDDDPDGGDPRDDPDGGDPGDYPPDDDGPEGITTDSADSAWRLTATARGVPLNAVDARDVKAVTYSEMRVEPTDAGWTAYVVFDV